MIYLAIVVNRVLNLFIPIIQQPNEKFQYS